MACSLGEINSAGLLTADLKPTVKPEELTINETYEVVKFSRHTGVYGPYIRVELQKGIVFLPRRFASVITTEKIEDLNKQKLGLVFRGMKNTPHRPTPLIEIVSV